MDDRAEDDLGNFAGHDLATEAELRQKEKEARKRKKKKEKKRREREKAWHCWQESERAGAGRGAGSLHAHALDMLGAGDVGSGGDDDDFSSPLNSGRGPSDGGLDGLYDEVFSGTTDTGHTGDGRINDGLDGFRPLSKKLPPAQLPTLSGGGGLPGLREPGALPSLPGDGGTDKPDFAAFGDLPPKPAPVLPWLYALPSRSLVRNFVTLARDIGGRFILLMHRRFSTVWLNFESVRRERKWYSCQRETRNTARVRSTASGASRAK